MDPNQALANLIEAVKSQDHEAYADALSALYGWDRGGGFMPAEIRETEPNSQT